MRSISLAFAMILGLGAGLVSCGEADKVFDCQAVCSRYQTCFNKSYDVGACRDRCRDKVSQAKADACESCIDDKSCTAATFTCATECGGIVP
mgnify:CR=1 FL=1